MTLFDLPAPAPEPESEPQPAGRQKCTDCRHWLTAPVPPERWVEGGCLGPKCAKGRGIKPAGSPRIAIRWRGPVRDQIELLEEINEGEDVTTTTAEREAKPCWVLIYNNGAEVDTGDGVPHYPSEERAAEDVSRWSLDGVAPAPRQLDQPCFEISECVCCEDSFGDNYGGEHFDSRAEAEKAAEHAGWVLAEDGTATCGECAKNPDCIAEAAAAKAEEGQ